MEIRSIRKEREGIVVSNKMDKTIIVKIEQKVTHKKYKKIISLTQNVAVHDEEKKALEGDKVIIRETRPLSKTKKWILVEVTNRKDVSSDSARK